MEEVKANDFHRMGGNVLVDKWLHLLRGAKLHALFAVFDVLFNVFVVARPPVISPESPLAFVDAGVGLVDLADDGVAGWLWDKDSFVVVDQEASRVDGQQAPASLDGFPEVWPRGSLFWYVFEVFVCLETFDEVAVFLVPFCCHDEFLELWVGFVDV